jgi:alkaline phosphatase
MKRGLVFLAFLTGAAVWAGAQTPDSLDRNRSKYATYSFSKDDQYTVETPYDIVNVQQPTGKTVKNVIFLIGDGMGFEQVNVGWVANGGKLNMTECMPVLGASRTYCTDRLITDSCAGGTALAIGQKTKYGYIGIDENAQPVESNLQWAKRVKGMKTGVTVTCRINDATPADFCVHGPSRKDEEGLAAQYVDANVDFISGGGTHFWNQRSDGRNLIEEMKAKGYTWVEKLADVPAAKGDKYLGLFEEYDMSPALDRGPVLLETTKKAIELLDNEKGFFLMIEGSQIDDYAHRRKVGQMCEELFDFDKTLGYVLEWAAKDGQTLVVVTADHCTGGLTLLKGSLEERTVKVHFSTKGHDGIMVPVFAFGPGSEQFAGIHENAEIGQIVRKLLEN